MNRREAEDATFVAIQSYVLARMELGWIQKLGLKLSSRVTVGIENYNYGRSSVDTSTIGGAVKVRDDTVALTSAALIYDIQKWLKATAEYTYRNYNSNFDFIDYNVSVGKVSLTAVY